MGHPTHMNPMDEKEALEGKRTMREALQAITELNPGEPEGDAAVMREIARSALKTTGEPLVSPHYGPDYHLNHLEFQDLVEDLFAFHERMREWDNRTSIETMRLDQWLEQIKAFNELRRSYASSV